MNPKMKIVIIYPPSHGFKHTSLWMIFETQIKMSKIKIQKGQKSSHEVIISLLNTWVKQLDSYGLV